MIVDAPPSIGYYSCLLHTAPVPLTEPAAGPQKASCAAAERRSNCKDLTGGVTQMAHSVGALNALIDSFASKCSLLSHSGSTMVSASPRPKSGDRSSMPSAASQPPNETSSSAHTSSPQPSSAAHTPPPPPPPPPPPSLESRVSPSCSLVESPAGAHVVMRSPLLESPASVILVMSGFHLGRVEGLVPGGASSIYLDVSFYQQIEMKSYDRLN